MFNPKGGAVCVYGGPKSGPLQNADQPSRWDYGERRTEKGTEALWQVGRAMVSGTGLHKGFGKESAFVQLHTKMKSAKDPRKKASVRCQKHRAIFLFPKRSGAPKKRGGPTYHEDENNKRRSGGARGKLGEMSLAILHFLTSRNSKNSRGASSHQNLGTKPIQEMDGIGELVPRGVDGGTL